MFYQGFFIIINKAKNEKHLLTFAHLMSFLQLHIEAMIFTATTPVKLTDLVATLNKTFNAETNKDESEKEKDEHQEISEEQIIDLLKAIKQKYDDEQYSWELKKSGGGFQFLTKPMFYNTVANLLNLKTKRKLTRSAMETLAIIAYKQPVTKPELEHIRGVSCDYAIQKLLDKELVVVSGRSDGPGKPLLYATSQTFMDYFGINSPDEMPTLKEFQTADQEIGTPQE